LGLSDRELENAMKRTNFLTVFILLLAACGPVPVGKPISACGDYLKAMQALTDGLELPANFRTENPAKTGGEFDVMQYFFVLDHLSMEPGYVLDYVYHYNGMGGYPVLYARMAAQPAYATEADLTAAGETPNYLDYVQADDTPEGYFQFIVLAKLGRQFYKFWHAGYSDVGLVCDKAGVMAAVASADQNFGKPMPLPARLRASILGYVEPRVLIGEKTVEVRIITFTLWGGFFRQTHTLQRRYPHTILNTQEVNLVPYDCGVMF
jgi:hypothetical protein